jgi:Ca2+-binding EF-hand superfamily protein
MRAAFEAVDRDANGQIDFDEFVEAQAKIGALPTTPSATLSAPGSIGASSEA